MMAELQDVFSLHWQDYKEHHPVSFQQEKAADAIAACRTSALGGHVDTCEDCGHERISYNSCRNRHCPKCQSVRRNQWVQERHDDLLDTAYFHVVFTIPSPLHELFRSNESTAYKALFQASADTLLKCAADERRLGAKIGFTSVLHTSGQNLSYHPHIHAIVCAGGIDGRGRWRESGRKFFIPVKVLSRVFRGKLTEALKNLPLTIRGEDDPKRIADLISLSWKTEWVVYAKKPFRDAACVIEYLGRYTHRTAISNSRILKVDGGSVTFRWRDYRDGNKMKAMVLQAGEFIRRFLMHVLPCGFMRIRHYGFLANNGKRERIERLRRLCKMTPHCTEKLSGFEIACKLAGRDITKCPSCGGSLNPRPLLALLC
jgi:hypothetical protein